MKQSIITYGGTLRPITEEHCILNAEWSSGVSLQVFKWAERPNILVYREDELLFRMVCQRGDAWEDAVKRTARKIGQGAYDRQKTAEERAIYLVERDQLTSCMNKTKWMELRQAMQKEMPFPPAYTLKLIDRTEDLEDRKKSVIPTYMGDWGLECLPPSLLVLVEWLKIDPRLAKSRGGLIEPEITDASDQLREVLTRHSIPYEEQGTSFVIYGYRRPE